MSDEKPADTGKVHWPEAKIGPFRYAVVGGVVLECKDGKWVDRDGKEATLALITQEKAAHRP